MTTDTFISHLWCARGNSLFCFKSYCY